MCEGVLCLVYINTDLNVDIRAVIIQTDFLMCSLVSVYETVEGLLLIRRLLSKFVFFLENPLNQQCFHYGELVNKSKDIQICWPVKNSMVRYGHK